jgi:hypothetical protein
MSWKWWCFECEKEVNHSHIKKVYDSGGATGTCKAELQTIVKHGETVYFSHGAIMGPELLDHAEGKDATKR